jgi:hypothetical protein
MDLVELGARSMDLVDPEFLELGYLTGKNWSGAVFVDLELRGALPNTPIVARLCGDRPEEMVASPSDLRRKWVWSCGFAVGLGWAGRDEKVTLVVFVLRTFVDLI